MIEKTKPSDKKYQDFNNPEVAAIFKAYPEHVAEKLLFLRQLIFDTASAIKEVGELEETIRWGQPSYLTTKSKSGSIIRIDQRKPSQQQYAIYFHCQTTLVDTFKEMFQGVFNYEGNRSIILSIDDKIPVKELSYCISLALTYHLNKKSGRNTL